MKHKKLLITVISFFSMIAMIANPKEIINSAQSALTLCSTALIPSIFPFMAASSVFINYSSQNGFKILAPILNFLFGTGSCAASALIPGMICGYPIGASCTCQLYKNNMISKSEAESLIAFSNNSGPLFIIGTVGIGLLNSAKYGTMLYAIHIVSAIICGILLKPFTKRNENTIQININTQKNFTDCISDSTLTILKICGFVVIFAVINKLLEPVINLLPIHFKCIVSGFLELTNASVIISDKINDTKIMLVLLSGALGWSGMSVHMQVKSIIASTDLSMKKYYCIRFLSCIISMIISYMVFTPVNLHSNTYPLSKISVPVAVSVIIVIIALIFDFVIKPKNVLH